MTDFYTKETLKQLPQETYKKLLRTDRGDCYRAESKFLVGLTGHEIAANKRDYFKALSYTNQSSHLGLSPTEVEVLGRMLSGLAEGTRFAGDPAMDPRHGENAATHSLQAVVSLEKLLSKAFKSLSNEQKVSEESALIATRQVAGLGLVLHDLGEILGESNTAIGKGARFEEGFDKTEMERLILSKTLEIAIGTHESAATRDDFLHIMQLMRDRLDIAGIAQRGGTITRAGIESVLNDPEAYPQYHLSPEGAQMHRQFMAIWEMAEQSKGWEARIDANAQLPENPNFIGQLIKSVEHAQGTRHLLRFARKDTGISQFLHRFAPALASALLPSFQLGHDVLSSSISSAIQAVKETLNIHPLQETTEDRIEKNFNYCESELPYLFAFASENSPLEQKLARAQRDEAYAISMNFLDEARGVFRQSNDEAFDPQASTKLRLLESVYDAYEQAIASDRIPPAGEKSLGAVCYHAMKDYLSEQRTPLPQVEGVQIDAKAQARERMVA